MNNITNDPRLKAIAIRAANLAAERTIHILSPLDENVASLTQEETTARLLSYQGLVLLYLSVIRQAAKECADNRLTDDGEFLPALLPGNHISPLTPGHADGI